MCVLSPPSMLTIYTTAPYTRTYTGTLLKMIASGELKVPPRIDYLYVEQEVVADETPAVDAVLKADK